MGDTKRHGGRCDARSLRCGTAAAAADHAQLHCLRVPTLRGPVPRASRLADVHGLVDWPHEWDRVLAGCDACMPRRGWTGCPAPLRCAHGCLHAFPGWLQDASGALLGIRDAVVAGRLPGQCAWSAAVFFRTGTCSCCQAHSWRRRAHNCSHHSRRHAHAQNGDGLRHRPRRSIPVRRLRQHRGALATRGSSGVRLQRSRAM
mmetsp:Transcript_51327/g.133355  ORF Transcript_51327/g.133355 Transcript_51327/m.133355 type:complete len:202 (+) Transcript_51327:625-1230(+)